MLKLEIKLDEQKIEDFRKYNKDNIYRALDNNFSHFQLQKMDVQTDGTVCYRGTGSSQDYGSFGCLITNLAREPWFMDYVTKWLWYNSDDGCNEEDFSIEDLLYFYTRRESVA